MSWHRFPAALLAILIQNSINSHLFAVDGQMLDCDNACCLDVVYAKRFISPNNLSEWNMSLRITPVDGNNFHIKISCPSILRNDEACKLTYAWLMEFSGARLYCGDVQQGIHIEDTVDCFHVDFDINSSLVNKSRLLVRYGSDEVILELEFQMGLFLPPDYARDKSNQSFGFTSPTNARIILPQDGILFGAIKVGEPKSSSIEIQNRSPFDVAVFGIKHNAVDVELPSRTIPRYGCAVLTVHVKPFRTGAFTHEVNVFCDDPERPVLRIPVSGYALEDATASANVASIIKSIVACAFKLSCLIKRGNISMVHLPMRDRNRQEGGTHSGKNRRNTIEIESFKRCDGL